MSQLKMIVLLERCHRVEEVRVGWGMGVVTWDKKELM